MTFKAYCKCTNYSVTNSFDLLDFFMTQVPLLWKPDHCCTLSMI